MLNLESLKPGQTKKGVLTPEVGYPVELPYFIVRGSESGPTLLVTAGVHGAEYASVESAYRVARTDPKTLKGTLIVLPILNPPSFFARSIYVNPVDGKNLNRMFPGRADGSFAERLAHWLSEDVLPEVDAYIDLHGGDLVEALTPFTIFRKDDSAAEELAEVFGLELLVESDSEVMTFTAAARLGVPAILAEAGGQGQWPEVEVERLRKGVERVMQHLGMLDGTPEKLPTRLLRAFAWLSAEHGGLWYPVVTAGERVEAGQDVGSVTSLLGEGLQKVVSPVAGTVLFSVSSLAMNEGDPLLGIGA